MQDHHVTELSKALRGIASSISFLAFAVLIGALTLGSCIAASHH